MTNKHIHVAHDGGDKGGTASRGVAVCGWQGSPPQPRAGGRGAETWGRSSQGEGTAKGKAQRSVLGLFKELQGGGEAGDWATLAR